MAEAPRSGTGGAAAANAMADDWPEIPDEITEDNPLFLRPLSEDLLHFKIISEKFNEVQPGSAGPALPQRYALLHWSPQDTRSPRCFCSYSRCASGS